MAATREMIEIARTVRPHAACLVPERRQERTTEGGLDVAGQREALARRVAQAGRGRHSRFAVHRARSGADRGGGARSARRSIEIHTGAWCDALPRATLPPAAARIRTHRARRRARRAAPASRCMPATGSISSRAEQIAALPEIVELNIGHFLIGEAIFDGLDEAVRRMRAAMDRGRAAVSEGRAS